MQVVILFHSYTSTPPPGRLRLTLITHSGWNSMDLPQNLVLTRSSCSHVHRPLSAEAWQADTGGWWLTYNMKRYKCRFLFKD